MSETATQQAAAPVAAMARVVVFDTTPPAFTVTGTLPLAK